MRIQHNIMAMNAYRNYNNNTSALSKNLEKLSSGYKINRAGDDAAGLAISEKMRAQITGLEQAQDNAKSGKNLVQTAEGALQEVHDMLNRMVKLADQSANGTFDNEIDRKALQDEIVELKSEINRIADSANYNGINLLDGSMDANGTVGGAAMDLTSALSAVKGSESIAEVQPKFSVDLDGMSIKVDATGESAAKKVVLTIGGSAVSATLSAGALASNATIDASALATAFNGKSFTNADGIKFTVAAAGTKLTFTYSSGAITQAINPDATVAFSYTGTHANATGSINTGVQVIQPGVAAKPGQLGTATLTLTADMLQNGSTITIGNETFTISYDNVYNPTTAAGNKTINVKDLLNDSGKLDATDVSEVARRITNASAGNNAVTIGYDGSKLTMQVLSTYNNDTGDYGDLTNVDNIKKLISVNAPSVKGEALTLQIGDTSDSFNRMSLSIQDIHTSTLNIADIDISTQKGAQEAVDKIKDAINDVSSIRAKLGATQNRLDHTINNLSVMTENIQDAESTIRDTDVAEEMMAYTKNNILVQSAQAMLAQANQVPQGVLQLLQ